MRSIYCARQTSFLVAVMKGVWVFDSRSAKDPRFTRLFDFDVVHDAINDIRQDEQNNNVDIIPYVDGLIYDETMDLLTQDFDERRGCIVIDDESSLRNLLCILYIYERIDLYPCTYGIGQV